MWIRYEISLIWTQEIVIQIQVNKCRKHFCGPKLGVGESKWKY